MHAWLDEGDLFPSEKADSSASFRRVARPDVLPFDTRAAAHYGQLRAEFERAGTPRGPHDMQIGGHARSGGLIVVSNNLREFSRMAGVRVEDWV